MNFFKFNKKEIEEKPQIFTKEEQNTIDQQVKKFIIMKNNKTFWIEGSVKEKFRYSTDRDWDTPTFKRIVEINNKLYFQFEDGYPMIYKKFSNNVLYDIDNDKLIKQLLYVIARNYKDDKDINTIITLLPNQRNYLADIFLDYQLIDVALKISPDYIMKKKI